MPIESLHLRKCVDECNAAVERMTALIAGLSAEQANFKPGPKKWSINECIEHLVITANLYHKEMAKALERGRENRGAEPYGKGTLVGRMILNNLRAGPNARKWPAPGMFHPDSSQLDLAKVADEFRRVNARAAEMAEQADGLALGKIKLGTPVFRLAKVTLAQAFEMQAEHQKRHLAQAERVKQAPGWPAAS